MSRASRDRTRVPPGIRCWLALSLLAAACGPRSPDWTEAERTAVSLEVDSAVRGFTDAERNLDVDAMLAFLAESPKFRMYNDGIRYDYASLEDQLRVGFGGLRSLEGGIDNLEITLLDRETALTSATFRETMVDTSGFTVRSHGAVTWVWKRQRDGWKILYGHAEHYPDSEQ